MSSRIANLARPGELLDKRTKRPKEPMGGKAPRKRDERHLTRIRELPCLACGRSAPSHAAHISMSDAELGKRGRGTGMKSDDRWTVPLCAICHDIQHRTGEVSFWSALGINAKHVAIGLWIISSPNLEAMRRVILNVRKDSKS